MKTRYLHYLLTIARIDVIWSHTATQNKFYYLLLTAFSLRIPVGYQTTPASDSCICICIPYKYLSPLCTLSTTIGTQGGAWPLEGPHMVHQMGEAGGHEKDTSISDSFTGCGDLESGPLHDHLQVLVAPRRAFVLVWSWSLSTVLGDCVCSRTAYGPRLVHATSTVGRPLVLGPNTPSICSCTHRVSPTYLQYYLLPT
jgi:hypothetical protein